MFDRIYCSPYNSSQTTKAIADGADVRYTMMFVAADDGTGCAFICTVYHPGVRDAVDFSAFSYGGKIASF